MVQESVYETWFCKLCPTPGKFLTTETLTACRCSFGPIPDNNSNWGEFTAPPEIMISREARATRNSPSWKKDRSTLLSISQFTKCYYEEISPHLIVLDSDSLEIFNDNLGDSGVESDMEITSIAHRTKESVGGAYSNSVFAGHLSYSKSRWLSAVVILRNRVSSLYSGTQNIASNFWLPGESFNRPKTIGGMVFAANSIDFCIILRALKVRQYLRKYEKVYREYLAWEIIVMRITLAR